MNIEIPTLIEILTFLTSLHCASLTFSSLFYLILINFQYLSANYVNISSSNLNKLINSNILVYLVEISILMSQHSCSLIFVYPLYSLTNLLFHYSNTEWGTTSVRFHYY